jgi:hypothetical protein
MMAMTITKIATRFRIVDDLHYPIQWRYGVNLRRYFLSLISYRPCQPDSARRHPGHLHLFLLRVAANKEKPYNNDAEDPRDD